MKKNIFNVFLPIAFILTACGGGSATPSTPTMSISDASVSEGSSGATILTFTVSLSMQANGDVMVDFSSSDGTATAGSDYTATTGTATIVNGTTSTAITVSITGDTNVESDETFTLTLSNLGGSATNAVLGAASATGTIINDDSVIGVPAMPNASLSFGIKSVMLSWNSVAGADFYRVLESPDGVSGFSVLTGADNLTATSFTKLVSAISQDWANALFIVEACNNQGCTGSLQLNIVGQFAQAIGYFKASNPDDNDVFGGGTGGGGPVLSADGKTLAVGVPLESSSSQGIDQDQLDNSAPVSGAVYLFRYDGTSWIQQSYIKASNSDASDWFGDSLALSGDGNTLAVGARFEASISSGINGDQSNNDIPGIGAVYLFQFNGVSWEQQAYIKASDNVPLGGFTFSGSYFGGSLALSRDSNTLAVASTASSTVVGDAGAVYLFRRNNNDWAQEALIQASNTDSGDNFGGPVSTGFSVIGVALSDDGNTLAVGALSEDGSATGINGDENDNSLAQAGAAYVFRYTGSNWSQQAYIKPSVIDFDDRFGSSVALSGDGDRLVVSAGGEDSNATGINGDPLDNSASLSGAAYVFDFDGTTWSQQAYIKASNTDQEDFFGRITLSSDGNTLAVGAWGEGSVATNLNGDQTNLFSGIGAVYIYTYQAGSWNQINYLKAPDSLGVGMASTMGFGYTISLDGTGSTLAVGAPWEDGNSSGIGGDQSDQSSSGSDTGAVFLY